jgi:hypothetical protein
MLYVDYAFARKLICITAWVSERAEVATQSVNLSYITTLAARPFYEIWIQFAQGMSIQIRNCDTFYECRSTNVGTAGLG